MDPDRAWAIILDPASTHEQRAEAALGLLAWLASEGFLPANIDVGRAGVIEVCKVAVEIALDQPQRHKELPRTDLPVGGSSTKYLRLLDLEERDIYLIEAANARVGVWNGVTFLTVHANRITDSLLAGDGLLKGTAKALEWIGTLPDRIELRIPNNKPLFNYLTSLEREHGSEPRGMDLHPR